MSVNAYLGKILTNRYAGQLVPGVAVNPVINDSYFADGQDDIDMDLVQTQTTDSPGSTYKLCTIPSNSRLHRLDLANDALGTGVLVDVGVYYPQWLPSNPALSGTVISENFFASAYSVAAAHDWTSIINQSGTNTLPLQQQNLWQALGLSADPICEFDLVITLNSGSASPTAAGNLAMKTENCI